ncbi:MAG: group II intron reverse transcriptase/maturase, partial [Lentisphaerae bacterium]|nr:group II intron reverse transcriptase/maturase [Lentisphaerota bacterium]
VIQQAIAQILSPIYEPQFSNNSYGFRPGRNAHDALRLCLTNITERYIHVVDMDLEKFFDTVKHSKLIQVLSKTIKDGRVVSLIHKYLNAGVVEKGSLAKTVIGVPQGGPLSPLLSNIMLNELDKELERRGHKYVRYADDCMILCKSKRAAQRTLKNITSFIERELFLKVNREKTVVARIFEVKFLGYGFYIKDRKGMLRVHPKSWNRMKKRIRELTSRKFSYGYEQRKVALKRYIIGWVNYFKLANMKSFLKEIDGWYRRRIRMVIWKQWKRIRTRNRNLVKLGVTKLNAWKLANTRKGYWRIARTQTLHRAINDDSLRRAGYLFFSTYYSLVRG